MGWVLFRKFFSFMLKRELSFKLKRELIDYITVYLLTSFFCCALLISASFVLEAQRAPAAIFILQVFLLQMFVKCPAEVALDPPLHAPRLVPPAHTTAHTGGTRNIAIVKEAPLGSRQRALSAVNLPVSCEASPTPRRRSGRARAPPTG